jgi:hypothetical protein
LSAVYDYGPLGSELKNNLKSYWWKTMVHLEKDIVGLDSAIFMDSKTWEASGHVDAFNDPLIDNKDSKKRYRADVLVEEYLLKIESKINKEISKGKKRFGDSFDENEFKSTNPRVLKYSKKHKEISNILGELLSSSDLKGLAELINELDISLCFFEYLSTLGFVDLNSFSSKLSPNLFFPLEISLLIFDSILRRYSSTKTSALYLFLESLLSISGSLKAST